MPQQGPPTQKWGWGAGMGWNCPGAPLGPPAVHPFLQWTSPQQALSLQSLSWLPSWAWAWAWACWAPWRPPWSYSCTARPAGCCPVPPRPLVSARCPQPPATQGQGPAHLPLSPPPQGETASGPPSKRSMPTPTAPWPRSELGHRGARRVGVPQGADHRTTPVTPPPCHLPCTVVGAPGLAPQTQLCMLCILPTQGGASPINDVGQRGSLSGGQGGAGGTFTEGLRRGVGRGLQRPLQTSGRVPVPVVGEDAEAMTNVLGGWAAWTQRDPRRGPAGPPASAPGRGPGLGSNGAGGRPRPWSEGGTENQPPRPQSLRPSEEKARCRLLFLLDLSVW